MSAVKIPHRRPLRSGNNSTAGEKVSENIRSWLAQFFGGRRVVVVVGVWAGLVIIVAGVFWYVKIYSSSTRTFWDMVHNNLSTSGVTTESVQKSGTQTSDMFTQLAFGAQPMARNIKEIDTSGPGSASKIEIESLGTSTDTYQHYILIDQPPAKGKPKANYSKVYPMWIKNGGSGQGGDASLFDNALFGGFLFGDLPPSQKATVSGYLANAYSIDSQNVVKSRDHGRKIYTYNVSMSVKDYAKAAKYYAQSMHLAAASQINPDSYKNTDKISMKVSIDVLSRQLRTVVDGSSDSTEQFSGYGIMASYKLPAKTISYNTLQQTVSKISGAK